MSLSQFDVRVDLLGDEAVVSLRGGLDMATAPALRERLSELAAASPPPRVVVDLAELDFIDSTGLSVIMSAMKRLRAAESELVLRNPQAGPRKVIDLTGLDKMLAVETSPCTHP
jgi:anti-sigma B factor antagonist